MQNSRIGFRADADVTGAHVIGYMEADFLGTPASTNIAVTSNSQPSPLAVVLGRPAKRRVGSPGRPDLEFAHSRPCRAFHPSPLTSSTRKI